MGRRGRPARRQWAGRSSGAWQRAGRGARAGRRVSGQRSAHRARRPQPHLEPGGRSRHPSSRRPDRPRRQPRGRRRPHGRDPARCPSRGLHLDRQPWRARAPARRFDRGAHGQRVGGATGGRFRLHRARGARWRRERAPERRRRAVGRGYYPRRTGRGGVAGQSLGPRPSGDHYQSDPSCTRPGSLGAVGCTDLGTALFERIPAVARDARDRSGAAHWRGLRRLHPRRRRHG